MRHCVAYLIPLFSIVWIRAVVSWYLDFGNHDELVWDLDGYSYEDSSENPDEIMGWFGEEGGWITDIEANPDLLVDASSQHECLSDTGDVQWAINRRLRRREWCQNNLFQTTSSEAERSHVDRKFLESLQIFTVKHMVNYKEPDPKLCPAESFGLHVYPICGMGEETMPDNMNGGITIDSCNPCTLSGGMMREECMNDHHLLDNVFYGCISPEKVWCCRYVDWLVSFLFPQW